MTLDEILEAFGQLVSARDDAPQDEPAANDNFRCVGCERCTSCRFCTSCTDCDDCTYCDACSNCQSCTQSRQCHDCVEVSHSGYSGACEGCSYVTLCYDCENCVHCFACVGLSGEEFCILNEHYSRKEYFAEVARLRAELDARSLDGWRPPWAKDEQQEDAELEPAPPVESVPPPPTARVGERIEHTWPDLDDASAWLDAIPPDPETRPTRAYAAVPRVQPPPDPTDGRTVRRGPLPWEVEEDAVAGSDEEGPTRPYPVIESADPDKPAPLRPAAPTRRGPSLRTAKRPPRRRPSDPEPRS